MGWGWERERGEAKVSPRLSHTVLADRGGRKTDYWGYNGETRCVKLLSVGNGAKLLTLWATRSFLFAGTVETQTQYTRP